MSWRDRKRGREIIPDGATLQVPRALASWAEHGSPVSGGWQINDFLEVVELEQKEFLEASVVRSKACGLSLEMNNMHRVIQSGDWCTLCQKSASDERMLARIVRLVKKLDHLGIAEDKMIGVPGGMKKCIEKAKSHEYYNCGTKWKPPWMRELLVGDDYSEDLVSSPLDEDKQCLIKMHYVPQKNEAFTHICDYNVALLTHSQPDS